MQKGKQEILVTLIHGTFARSAEWTMPHSDLVAALSAQVDKNIRVERLEWSGANTVEARMSAADALIARVEQEKRSSPETRHFVIGHSHGGSVIAFALKKSRAVREGLAGAAFLSTPFINIRVKPGWRDIGQAILLAVGLWVAALLTLIYLLVVVSIGATSQSLIQLALVIFAAVVGAFRVSRSAFRVAERRWEAECERLSTARIPKGRYAFFRSSGDEAAGVLSVGQMLNWTLGKLNTALAAPIVFLARPKAFRVACAIFVVFLLVAAILVSEHFQFRSSPMLRDIPEVIFPVHGDLVILVPYYFVLTAFLSVLLFTALWMLSSLLGALAFFLFGRVVIFHSMFLDVAVEPLPLGEYSLFHSDWSNVRNGDLSHSSTYAARSSISAICKWINDACGQEVPTKKLQQGVISMDSALEAAFKYHAALKRVESHPPPDPGI